MSVLSLSLRPPRRSPSHVQARVFVAAVALLLCAYPNIAASSGVDADGLLREANIARASQGARVLSWNPLLANAAQRRADELLRTQEFIHARPNGTPFATAVTASGYTYRTVGENLAIHYFDAPTITRAWLNSTGHRANLLNDEYRDVGVGIASGTMNDQPTTVVVQLYGNPGGSPVPWERIAWYATMG